MFWVLLIASKLAFSYYIEVFFLSILRTYDCYCCCYVFLCCCNFLYGVPFFFFWLNQTNKWYRKSNYLIVLKSKKQTVISRSSVEAEYGAMAHISCELMWIKQLLEELKFVVKVPMSMHCDNQAAIHVSSNLVFHEQNKHIAVDCHITMICFYKRPNCWYIFQSFM